MHSFFLFSLIWSFGANLIEEKKIEFEKWLKKKCAKHKAGDFETEDSHGEISDDSYQP
jgi:hypothetical protein